MKFIHSIWFGTSGGFATGSRKYRTVPEIPSALYCIRFDETIGRHIGPEDFEFAHGFSERRSLLLTAQSNKAPSGDENEPVCLVIGVYNTQNGRFEQMKSASSQLVDKASPILFVHERGFLWNFVGKFFPCGFSR